MSNPSRLSTEFVGCRLLAICELRSWRFFRLLSSKSAVLMGGFCSQKSNWPAHSDCKNVILKGGSSLLKVMVSPLR